MTRETALETVLREEQVRLWSDLERAIRHALNSAWSIECEGLASRITAIASLVGPTPWDQVGVTLLRSGIYEMVLETEQILYPEIDWKRVSEVEAYIAGGLTGR